MGIDDTRNVVDKFKGKLEQEIIDQLDSSGVDLQIAIENLERDFNMGTIVRSANAFGIRHVHIIGRRQWNKRGAMATDKYLHVHYHSAVAAFKNDMTKRGLAIVAVDNIEGSAELHSVTLPQKCVLVFGAEGSGLSPELVSVSEQTVQIEQLGSTRSLNVGVAAGIVMYAWLQQNYLR